MVPHGGSQLIAKTRVTTIQVMTIPNPTMKDEEQSKEAREEFEHVLQLLWESIVSPIVGKLQELSNS